ncbi:CreA family protein [Hydrogenophilus thiooxidans]|uniref:CreA family protein n=1 Tax=Hydrogenophilus thiooxidans TaxID=2820326 RepID=UPI001C217AEF|nr:CreA family protein [Hydrogenophilus thiooxidans]
MKRSSPQSVGFALGLLLSASVAFGEEIGEVSTVWKLIGPNHKIVVEAFPDPDVDGVVCYVSRAKTGGIKGALGVAEDPSDASIACRQVAPLRFKRALPQQDSIFSERASLIFKKVQVVRMVDRARNVLVYLTYSDRLIEGSPKNSITAVAVGDQKIPLAE